VIHIVKSFSVVSEAEIIFFFLKFLGMYDYDNKNSENKDERQKPD